MSEPKKRRSRERGDGSIRQRDDGRFEATVSLGVGPDGKRVRKSVYDRTRAGVKRKMETLKAKHAIGGVAALAEASRLTLAEHIDAWLAGPARNKAAGKTLERYEERAAVLKQHGGTVRLRDITAHWVEQLYARMGKEGLSDWTRKNAADILTNALNSAVKSGLIASNPAAGVAKPRPAKKEMRCLDAAQARRLIEATGGSRMASLFALALGGGLRQGELLALRWGDVDLDAGTVSVRRSLSELKTGPVEKSPKSAAGLRRLRVAPSVVEAMRKRREDAVREGNADAPVFCTKNGTWQTKSNLIRKVFQPALAKAEALGRAAGAGEFPAIRFHDMRHTHASILISAGASLKEVSRRLGHSSVELTLRVYAHVLPGDEEKVVGLIAGALG